MLDDSLPKEETLSTRRDFLKNCGLIAKASLFPLALIGCSNKEKVSLEQITNTTEPHEDGAVVAVPENMSVQTFGGYDKKGDGFGTMALTDEIYYVNNPSAEWRINREQNLTLAAYMAYFVWGDRIFAVGGKIRQTGEMGYGKIVNAVFSRNISGGPWKQEKDFPVKIEGATGIVVGKPYILGGHLEDKTNTDIYIRDESKDRWDVGGKTEDPLIIKAVAALDEEIYVFHKKWGKTSSSILLTIYNTRSKEWKKGKVPKILKDMYVLDDYKFHPFTFDNNMYIWIDESRSLKDYTTGMLYKYLTENSLEKICVFRLPREQTYNKDRAFLDGYIYFIGPMDTFFGRLTKYAYRLQLPLKKMRLTK